MEQNGCECELKRECPVYIDLPREDLELCNVYRNGDISCPISDYLFSEQIENTIKDFLEKIKEQKKMVNKYSDKCIVLENEIYNLSDKLDKLDERREYLEEINKKTVEKIYSMADEFGLDISKLKEIIPKEETDEIEPLKTFNIELSENYKTKH